MHEFTRLVREMRKVQKEYYRFKHRSDLQKAIKLEMTVDAILETYKIIDIPQPSQKGLFQDEIQIF